MEKLKDTLQKIEKCDSSISIKVWEKLDMLTKPAKSLGLLEELAVKLCVIKGTVKPRTQNKVIFTMAGDHGVCANGVSLFPARVTAQMVGNFLRGGAGVNVLAKHIGAEVVVGDIGVAEDIILEAGYSNFINRKINYGTKDFSVGAAMSVGEAVASIEAGISIFEEQHLQREVDIAGLGDMGIGNTTSSSAITSLVTKKEPEFVTGRGTGIDDNQLKNKVNIIKRAIAVNAPNAGDGIDILHKVGGYEIGALAGIILAAAGSRVPVVIDGFITASSALIAALIEPKTKEYMFASHNSVECGHKAALDWLGVAPIFDLRLRLGEGTGACLAINIIEASAKILNEMATFESANISRESK